MCFTKIEPENAVKKQVSSQKSASRGSAVMFELTPGKLTSNSKKAVAMPTCEHEVTMAVKEARFYDPDLGRFLQVDPAGEFWNSYSYGPNNPISGVDETGRIWNVVIGAAVGIGVDLAVQTAENWNKPGKWHEKLNYKSLVVSGVMGGAGTGWASIGSKLGRTANAGRKILYSAIGGGAISATGKAALNVWEGKPYYQGIDSTALWGFTFAAGGQALGETGNWLTAQANKMRTEAYLNLSPYQKYINRSVVDSPKAPWRLPDILTGTGTVLGSVDRPSLEISNQIFFYNRSAPVEPTLTPTVNVQILNYEYLEDGTH